MGPRTCLKALEEKNVFATSGSRARVDNFATSSLFTISILLCRLVLLIVTRNKMTEVPFTCFGIDE